MPVPRVGDTLLVSSDGGAVVVHLEGSEAPAQGLTEPSEVSAAEVALLRERLDVLLGPGWEEAERARHTDTEGLGPAVCLPIRAALRLLGDLAPLPSDRATD